MSDILNRLRDHELEQHLKISRDIALSAAKSNMDASKPRRFISGCAIGSREKNANGDSFTPTGVQFRLPIPLLLDHDDLRAIGLVYAVESFPDFLLFKAEIANSGRREWVEHAWRNVILQRGIGVSVFGRNHRAQPGNSSSFISWSLEEISLCDAGADPNARCTRAWERSPAVYLDRRSTETVYWDSSRVV